MYSINMENGKVNLLYKDTILVKGIQPRIRFTDTTSWPVTLTKSLDETGTDSIGQYVTYLFTEKLDGEKTWLSLAFKCYKDACVISVDLTAQSRWHALSDKTFLPKGGVSLTVDGLPELSTAMGNYLHKEWWTRPWFGTSENSLTSLPDRTQSLVWQKFDSTFALMLPVSGSPWKSELIGTAECLELSMSTYAPGFSTLSATACVISTGDDPYRVMEEAVRIGLVASGSMSRMRKSKRLPEVWDYLGWCTWDAFYHDVNEDGILAKMTEFTEKKLPVRWIIIDDGWSDSKGDSQLMSFSADQGKFPRGLGPLVSDVKTKYGVGWVGVWHAMTGYWNGIHPESSLALEYKDSLYRTGAGRLLPKPERHMAFRFWDGWHSTLAKQGVDFVKVDFQSSVMRMFRDNEAVGKVALESHAALEASVGKNFDNTIINCMGMAAENMWNRPVSSLTRTSDDFFPKEADSVSEHVLQNVYNSYYHSPLYWGDWDMWWTGPDQGTSHAVMRAISGGPIYVSDPVGTTQAEKIWPLILNDGRVLRGDLPGQPTADCLTKDCSSLGRPVKVWNRVGKVGYIAAFNADTQKTGKKVSGQVAPSDVPGLETSSSYAVREYFTGDVTVVDYSGTIDTSLEIGGVALYCVVPVVHGFASFGLINKYLGTAAAEVCVISDRKVIVKVKSSGTFGFISSKPVAQVFVDDMPQNYREQSLLYLVDSLVEEASIEIIFV